MCLDASITFYFERQRESEDLGLPGIECKDVADFKDKRHRIYLDVRSFRKSDDELVIYVKQVSYLSELN